MNIKVKINYTYQGMLVISPISQTVMKKLNQVSMNTSIVLEDYGHIFDFITDFPKSIFRVPLDWNPDFVIEWRTRRLGYYVNDGVVFVMPFNVFIYWYAAHNSIDWDSAPQWFVDYFIE